jgi:hypothetical protein
MNVNEAQVTTTTGSNEVLVVPQGARTIDIKNTGGASITFIGNSSSGSLTLQAVTIATNESYSFGDVGKPYPSITVDCTSSSCDISITY